MKCIRRGYTLIESLAAIAIITVTLTVATITMHSLHRAERRVRGDLQDQRVVERLAAQLRWDAHEALSAETIKGQNQNQIQIQIPSAPRGVTLTLATGRSILYAILPNHIERIVHRNEDIEHREIFRIVSPESFWSLDSTRDRPLLTLHLIHSGERPTSVQDSPSEQAIQVGIGMNRSTAKK